MQHISVNELYPKWLIANEKGDSITIIDVREVAEYAQAHVPGAKLLTLSTVPARSDEFPSQGDVYVICRSGMRSSQAIDFLEKNHGHQNLINVTGGTMAWMEANYPVEEGV